MNPKGEEIEGAYFNELVKTKGFANDEIASLTGIINELMVFADEMDTVGKNF